MERGTKMTLDDDKLQLHDKLVARIRKGEK